MHGSLHLNHELVHKAAVEALRRNEMSLEGVQKLASYMLERSFRLAIKEVRQDPYSMGPEQRFLMNDPDFEWDARVDLWCSALDMDYPSFRDRVSDLLDKLAEKVILDPEFYHLPVADNDDDDGDEDDAVTSSIILHLFLDLPIQPAPRRDVIRIRRPKPQPDDRQTSFIDLLAA